MIVGAGPAKRGKRSGHLITADLLTRRLVSHETEKLREDIRQGRISPEVNRQQWEWAVARIYEVERAEEAELSKRTLPAVRSG